MICHTPQSRYLLTMRAVATTVLAAAILMTATVGASVAAGGLSPRRIAAAAARAERSPQLWATVNICSSRDDPDALGIRGQMPTLGFPVKLWMDIQVNYWSAATKRFLPIKSAAATRMLALGQQSSGLQQDGAIFPFGAHAGLLDATITFTWTRGGTTIGQAVRRTTAGHPTAAYGSPPHYSAAQCTIK
jgi:hypothetical protein